MTETSGPSMRVRSWAEATKIVHDHFSECIVQLRQDQLNQLIELLSQYSPFYCDNCHKTGTLIQVHIARPGASPELVTSDCVCSKFKRINEKLQVESEIAGIPVRYRNARVDSWTDPASTEDEKRLNTRSIQVIQSYCTKLLTMQRKGYGLFLCGPNGVGKTYLACAAALAAIRDGFRVKYYTMPKIVRTVVDGWYDDAKKEVVNDIEEADFLVIDDVDKAYQTRSGLEVTVLDNLFRERLQNNRPMIVTSNKTPTQLKETHSESIHSMLSEHCALCAIVGQDYRKKIAGKMVDDILNS